MISKRPVAGLPIGKRTKRPKITGTPKSNCTLIRPRETVSAMCSKCMVSPLIKTPIAMIESKGPYSVEDVWLPGIGVELRPRPPSRSPDAPEDAWIWDAEYRLMAVKQTEPYRGNSSVYRCTAIGSSQLPGTL